MQHLTGVHEAEAAEPSDDPLDDVDRLLAEFAANGSGCRTDLMRLLLSRIALDTLLQGSTFRLCALLDVQGKVLEVNDAVLDGVGVSRRDIRGRPLWEARWWQGMPEVLHQFRTMIGRAAIGELIRHDVEIIDRAGGMVPIRIDLSIRPVLNRAGTVSFLLCEGREAGKPQALGPLNQAILEARVIERTRQLAASNARLRAEAEERGKTEDRLSLLVEGVVDYAIYMLDPDGLVTNWNTGAQRIKGYQASEIVGRHFSQFFTEADRAADHPAISLEIAATVGRYEAEGWRVRNDGSLFWASVVIDAIRDKNRRLLGFAKITRDITERRDALLALQRSQEQLAQAQKMEGIGHLTGGVAHDFNNLLMIIMGNIETLQRMLKGSKPDPDRLRRLADNAMLGAERAATLTHRLLAFSRRQPLDPKVAEVGRLVTGMSDLLRRSLGAQVTVTTLLPDNLWQIYIDPNQLEIAILNLAINARDAMPQGGSLTIEAANADLDDFNADGQDEVASGPYVVVSITDTGSGMTPEVAARAFEPFYTTKDVGHGTGLGLSQVYGFVKQSGGHIRIDSGIGLGTTVTLYLPRFRADPMADAAPARDRASTPGRGSETILVVEDEENVRRHAVEILQELGYRTFEAADGRSALQILQAYPEIQLLFTDIGLPGGMNGYQLADEVRRLNLDLRILFTTGYGHDAIPSDGSLDPGLQLITKPFSFAALAAKLRNVLDVDPT